MFNQGQTKQETEVLLDEEIGNISSLLLYNDDVNTFDHVIECLIRICDHDELQAEQCALLVHFKGKAVVKSGNKSDLAAMCLALCDEGLSAVITD